MTTVETNRELIMRFKGKNPFTKHDLSTYFSERGTIMSDDAIRKRIQRLKYKGILSTIGRGIYVINDKRSFKPKLDPIVKKIHKIYNSQYNDLDYCIWTTTYLHNLMLHIPTKSFHVFETEKEICEDVFHYFKDNGLKAYYIPDTDQVDKYILSEDKSIVVKPIITRAPYKTVNKIRFASIEKILVDIYFDSEMFYLYRGSEMERIFENAFDLYNINFSKLFAYSKRRSNTHEFRNFFLLHFPEIINQPLI